MNLFYRNEMNNAEARSWTFTNSQKENQRYKYDL